MAQLLAVVRAVAARGFSRTLRAHRGLMGEMLSPGYNLSQWLNDGEVDVESRRFFRAIVSKVPYVDEIVEQFHSAQVAACECWIEDQRAWGAGAGYLLNLPTLCCTGDPRYDVCSVRVVMSQLLADGEVVCEEHELCSLTTVGHVIEKEPWLAARIEAELSDGATFLEVAADLAPYLRFSQSAAGQIAALDGTEPFFAQIVRHLRTLNDTAAAWNGGPFRPKGITASFESKATLEHGTYGPMRDFACSDGIIRRFSDHSKPTGGNVRIYYMAVHSASPVVEIGYVGQHLPTVKF